MNQESLINRVNKGLEDIRPYLEQIGRDLELVNKLGLKLEYIFETHVHADHITGADTIRKRMNAKVVYGS